LFSVTFAGLKLYFIASLSWKEGRKKYRGVLSARLLQQPHLLEKSVETSDVAWPFQHDLETKHQDLPWKSSDPKPQ
jgi:hypothetical protein